MSASTRLSDDDVARILNKHGASGWPEDMSDVFHDYFNDDTTQRDDDDFELESNQGEDEFMAPREGPDEELIVPIIRLQTFSPEPSDDILSADDSDSFLKAGCGCARDCVNKFPHALIRQSVLDSSDNDMYCTDHVNHQHLLLLGALNTIVNNQPQTNQKDHAPHARIETRALYMFRGVEVCRKFFCFVFGCGEKRLKNVRKQFLVEGITARKHGNVCRASSVLNFDKRKEAVTFIQNFAENNALFLPGRLPNYRNSDLKLLPSSMTKKYVYTLYCNAAVLKSTEPLSLSLFYQVWVDFCNNVVIQLPRSDLCTLCQQNQTSVSKMQNLAENVKLQLIQKCNDHLVVVQKEREHYRQVIDLCKHQSNCPTVLGINKACSFSGRMHIGFDFAQQIHLPYDSQQVGPIYFLTGYKIALFGIAVEPLGKFVLYIIPEACATGKGSNIVISLLHHFLQTFGVGEMDLMCHADNCTGQNKNNYMMQYACWRTCIALHNSVTISFLPVGHTKFWPDLYFGLFKKKLRSDKAETVSDVCRIARDACPVTGAIIPVPVGDESGNVLIPTYDWQAKFDANKIPIPDLKQYHSFLFAAENKGTVICKKLATDVDSSGVVFNTVKDLSQLNTDLPEVVQPLPFSLDRQKYLAEKIRPFVTCDRAKDILCPFPPTVTEPVAVNSDVCLSLSKPTSVGVGQKTAPIEVAVAKRKPPLCSYCKQAGHRNQIRNGIALCPKRKIDFLQQ